MLALLSMTPWGCVSMVLEILLRAQHREVEALYLDPD
jgi:hypothetical protein